MNRSQQRLTRRHGARVGFVLLEVLVSLTILGVTVAACMRSFTQSISAIRQVELKTQANFFAQQLLAEFEVFPPEEGVWEGGFGEDYEHYFWRAEVSYESPHYRQVLGDETIDQYFSDRVVTLQIFHDDGRGRGAKRLLSLRTAIVGFEKFSFRSKLAYCNY